MIASGSTIDIVRAAAQVELSQRDTVVGVHVSTIGVYGIYKPIVAIRVLAIDAVACVGTRALIVGSVVEASATVRARIWLAWVVARGRGRCGRRRSGSRRRRRARCCRACRCRRCRHAIGRYGAGRTRARVAALIG